MLDRVPNTPLPLFRLSLYFPVFSSFKYSISYNLTGINMSRSIRMIPQVIYHQSLIILIELLVVFLITTLFMQTLRYHPGFAFFSMVIWDEVFKNGASKIFRIHLLQNYTIFLKAVFLKFYLFHSWIFFQFIFFKFVHIKWLISRTCNIDYQLLHYRF